MCYVMHSAYTETGATKTMKANQKAELIETIDSNNFKFHASQSNVQYKTVKLQLVCDDAYVTMVSMNKFSS